MFSSDGDGFNPINLALDFAISAYLIYLGINMYTVKPLIDDRLLIVYLLFSLLFVFGGVLFLLRSFKKFMKHKAIEKDNKNGRT